MTDNEHFALSYEQVALAEIGRIMTDCDGDWWFRAEDRKFYVHIILEAEPLPDLPAPVNITAEGQDGWWQYDNGTPMTYDVYDEFAPWHWYEPAQEGQQ